MPDTKEVEDMEKFMTVLMEVKVSLGVQNEKLDNLLDIKEKVDKTYDFAMSADSLSKQNKVSLDALEEDMEKKIDKKADKDDVERIVQEKDNWMKNAPAWGAFIMAAIGIWLNYI